jgi:hypothetical protein
MCAVRQTPPPQWDASDRLADLVWDAAAAESPAVPLSLPTTPTRTFSPLADLLSERTASERLSLAAKFASLMSDGLTIKLLEAVLPLDSLNTTSVRHHLQAVAQRCEDE